MAERHDHHRTPMGVDHTSLRARAVDAGRWFVPYLVVLGVLSGSYIVVLETVSGDRWTRLATGTAWAALFLAGHYWAERQDVHPAGGKRLVAVAFAVWLAAYALVLGPLVRWRYDDSLVAWTVASAVMVIPFMVAAWRVATRR